MLMKAMTLMVMVPLGGCEGVQSALNAQSHEAGDIAWLIAIFTIVCAAIWIAVMLALGIGLVRGERPASAPPLSREHYGPGRTRVIAALTGLTAFTVIALTVLSYLTDKSLATTGGDGLQVTLTGHQWWWEIRYDDPNPSRRFTTANELHLPVGVPVHIQLQSTDVIHSFWVPSLAGKEDLIPGWKNEITFTPQTPGLYRGQCAEFCGLQHAHMGLLVFVEPREQFESWFASRVQPAADPSPGVRPGRDVFMRAACILCHSVRGSKAGGRVAPDLTHFGSRHSIAADTLELTHENLIAWIRDPQGVKPGANMPRVPLDDKDLDAVARYLESLK